MIQHLIKCKNVVEEVLRDVPESRDDDMLLLLMCWKMQGILIPQPLVEDIHTFGLKPESIRRTRQYFQAQGEYKGTKREARKAHAEPVKEWIKEQEQPSEHPKGSLLPMGKWGPTESK